MLAAALRHVNSSAFQALRFQQIEDYPAYAAIPVDSSRITAYSEHDPQRLNSEHKKYHKYEYTASDVNRDLRPIPVARFQEGCPPPSCTRRVGPNSWYLPRRLSPVSALRQ